MDERASATALPLALLAGEPGGSTGPVEPLLAGDGYAVMRAPTGRLALARARGTHPDLVAIDADLTDMPMLDLCRALRLEPRIATGTPLVAVSANPPTRAQRLEALAAGAWDWIAAPFDAEDLLARLAIFTRAKLDADRARAAGLLDPLTGLYNHQGLARRARELGSQAFRQHEAMACVTVALDLEPDAAQLGDYTAAAVVRCVQTLKATARVSDAIGRLGPTEFAIIAPSTDAIGAVKLAARLVGRLEAAAASVGPPRLVSRVRTGYEAVSNVGYTPFEPVDLLSRASAALRRDRPEP